MDYIELKWVENGDRVEINSSDIDSIIEIDKQNKELKNIKKFFREIIYKCYINDWDKKIVLIENNSLEIIEVKAIIDELIDICNEKLSERVVLNNDTI